MKRANTDEEVAKIRKSWRKGGNSQRIVMSDRGAHQVLTVGREKERKRSLEREFRGGLILVLVHGRMGDHLGHRD